MAGSGLPLFGRIRGVRAPASLKPQRQNALVPDRHRLNPGCSRPGLIEASQAWAECVLPGRNPGCSRPGLIEAGNQGMLRKIEADESGVFAPRPH